MFLLAGAESVDRILYPLGLLGTLVGFVLFGVATFRARVLPRWCGVLFVLLVPVAVVLGEYGNMFDGLAQLALGYVLWLRRGATAGQAARVAWANPPAREGRLCRERRGDHPGGPRRAGGDRRLRHRLLVALLPQALPGRLPRAGQLVCGRPGGRGRHGPEITGAVVSLAHSLKLRVVGEGIETAS